MYLDKDIDLYYCVNSLSFSWLCNSNLRLEIYFNFGNLDVWSGVWESNGRGTASIFVHILIFFPKVCAMPVYVYSGEARPL